MATNKNRRKDDPDEPQSGPGLVISLLISIVIGVLGGGAFGYFVVPAGPAVPPAEASPAPAAAETSEPAPTRFPRDALDISLPSIIVNIGPDQKSSVRLDLSLVVAHGTPETSALKSEVREDVIAFLKGLDVKDIEGVRGFQTLREQLDDRAKIRGRGAILGLLVGGLIVE